MEEVKNVVANENFDWNAFENDLGVYDQDKAQITEAYDKTLSNVNVGEVVEGTVTGVNKREVIVNVGCGESKGNAKEIEAICKDIATITGQKPITCKARKSVANFKLREGMPIGAKVTLRGERMYEFVDRLFNVALPRVRDFRGINGNSFDGRGNYAFGLKEQIIFPEIDFDKVDAIRGMDICFVTTAKTDEEAKELLKALGAPFAN